MVPRASEAVVFSIDGSFLAAYSLRAIDPKIRGGAVDVVRYLFYLLLILLHLIRDLAHYIVNLSNSVQSTIHFILNVYITVEIHIEEPRLFLGSLNRLLIRRLLF